MLLFIHNNSDPDTDKTGDCPRPKKIQSNFF